MKNQNVTDVLQAILTWCGSFMGTVTILVILAVIVAIIVMAVKESYDENSFGYRVFRLAITAFYVIIALNLAGNLIIGAFCNIGTLIVYLLSIKWLTTTVLAIIYIIGLWIAYDNDSIIPSSIVTVIVAGGLYGIYQNIPVVIIFGIIAGLISYGIYMMS